MKNTFYSLVFFLLLCLSAKCQVGCPIFPSKSLKDKKSLSLSFQAPKLERGYAYFTLGFTERLFPQGRGTGYWGVGVEQSLGKHLAIAATGLFYARVFETGQAPNLHPHLALKYYHKAVLKGWGFALDITQQSLDFEPILYKFNCLYAESNRKQDYSTVLCVGVGTGFKKDFFVGANLLFCFKTWGK